MANSGDWYGGPQHQASNGFVAEWTLTPAGLLAPAPVTITCYEIFQKGSGTAVAIAFYDLPDGPPANGTPLFNNDPTADAAFVLPIAAPGTILLATGLPGHTFYKCFSAVATTALDNLTRANSNTLFAVHFLRETA